MESKKKQWIVTINGNNYIALTIQETILEIKEQQWNEKKNKVLLII